MAVMRDPENPFTGFQVGKGFLNRGRIREYQ